MTTMPMLQIRQQYGQIGIDAGLGQYSIEQPKADVQIKSNPATIQIDQHQPELVVDSSRARAAYTGGNQLEMTQRLYSSVKQIFLQGIAKRVEEGNRMAEFFKPGNTIAEVYGKSEPLPVMGEFRGEASIDNVDVHFNIRETDIYIEQGSVDINVQVNKPKIEYQRGPHQTYMIQNPSVTFIPPEIDQTV